MTSKEYAIAISDLMDGMTPNEIVLGIALALHYLAAQSASAAGKTASECYEDFICAIQKRADISTTRDN